MPYKTPIEQERARHALATERMALEAAAETVGPVLARRAVARYAELGEKTVSTTEVHADLNRIFGLLSEDDGGLAKRCCRQKLLRAQCINNPRLHSLRAQLVNRQDEGVQRVARDMRRTQPGIGQKQKSNLEKLRIGHHRDTDPRSH